MRSNFGYGRYSFIVFMSSCGKLKKKKCKSKVNWSRFTQSFKSLSPSEKALFAEWSGQLPISINDVALFSFNVIFSLSAKDLCSYNDLISIWKLAYTCVILFFNVTCCGFIKFKTEWFVWYLHCMMKNFDSYLLNLEVQ